MTKQILIISGEVGLVLIALAVWLYKFSIFGTLGIPGVF